MSSLEAGATAQLGIGATQAQVTERFQQQLLAALSDPLFNLPKVFLTYITDYVATSGFNVPIGQVLGFAGFQFQPATAVPTAQTTTSTAYTNLGTAGPTISGLSAGSYAVFFGYSAGGISAGATGLANLSVNGAAIPDDTNAAICSTSLTSVSRLLLRNLTLTDNSIATKYRSNTGGSCEFYDRWLVVVKYANL